jgi:hypothetical protein
LESEGCWWNYSGVVDSGCGAGKMTGESWLAGCHLRKTPRFFAKVTGCVGRGQVAQGWGSGFRKSAAKFAHFAAPFRTIGWNCRRLWKWDGAKLRSILPRGRQFAAGSVEDKNVSRRVAEGDITDGMGRRLGLAIALSPAALNSSTTVGGFVSTTIFGHPGPVRRAEESIRQSRVNCC